MRLGVIILAGGRSSRMGVDKASQLWNGRRAVDRLIEVARALDAQAIVTSGAKNFGAPFVPDETEDGGPVAGLVAGAAALVAMGCDRGLALAVDAPTLRAEDLAPLLAAPPPGAAFRDLHLPLAWRLSATPAEAGAGWAVGRFIAAMGLARPPSPPGAEPRLRGANTPQEFEALVQALSAAEPER
ncbi:MAG: NTP transferase domain-containing protein [Proteobacteria bacterium]|nr:NTP transferase domain-containing protein [Pseudomonadota bacterium]